MVASSRFGKKNMFLLVHMALTWEEMMRNLWTLKWESQVTIILPKGICKEVQQNPTFTPKHWCFLEDGRSQWEPCGEFSSHYCFPSKRGQANG